MTNTLPASHSTQQERERLTAEVLEHMAFVVYVYRRNFRQPKDIGLFELTMPQCRAVCFLAEGPARMSRIAEALEVSLPSATATIDRLVERGLVSRGEDPEDRRLVICELTGEGRRVISSLYDADLATTRVLLSSLTYEELQVVLQALLLMRKAAGFDQTAVQLGGA